ncbi:MAG: monovalent cation/H(+) antiporter subunit G [Planctomycetota bacterium]
MAALELAGALLVLTGSAFLFLGALGIVRMPDLYNRMQAGTKATTLGNVLTLAGLALLAPSWWPKILLIVLFVLITNPLSSHALARAAHRAGLPLAAGSVTDALAGKPDGDEAAEVAEPGEVTE